MAPPVSARVCRIAGECNTRQRLIRPQRLGSTPNRLIDFRTKKAPYGLQAPIKRSTPKNRFRERFQIDHAFQALRAKIFVFRFSELCVSLLVSRARSEGRCASSGVLRAGCGGRGGVARRATPNADGQVVWS